VANNGIPLQSEGSLFQRPASFSSRLCEPQVIGYHSFIVGARRVGGRQLTPASGILTRHDPAGKDAQFAKNG
jgi:hypothetical protein